mmetsp:Transcript_126918/g.237268  ORF Transcript_126918/g.237268 Transcript_126918/m.237268 type:complete len:568 (-) Transcript_126918:28-1731(-)
MKLIALFFCCLAYVSFGRRVRDRSEELQGMLNPSAAFACHPCLRSARGTRQRSGGSRWPCLSSLKGHARTSKQQQRKLRCSGVRMACGCCGGGRSDGGVRMAEATEVRPPHEFTEQRPEYVLKGGKPCGSCGELFGEPDGQYSDIGIFYCSECSRIRGEALIARIQNAREEGLAAAEDPTAREAAEFFFYAKAEAAIREQDIAALMLYLELLPELCVRLGPGGRTLLHVAASQGDMASAKALLDAFASNYGEHVPLLQAPEGFPDAHGITPGECAFINNHQEVFDMLVTSACDRARSRPYSKDQNKAYVESKLKYEGDVLLDENGGGVMMGWEEPLMKMHAAALAPVPGKAVMNIGFGLGLVDGFLQERQPSKHTIVEAHPDVYAEMVRRGWPEREGVNIVRGRWEDVVEEMVAAGPYDGVFFDTYDEAYGDLHDFFKLLPRLLKPGGRFSFFNGLGDRNIFSQAISTRVAQLDLESLGLRCKYEPIFIGEIGDADWHEVLCKYWSLETYYSPLAVMSDSPDPTWMMTPSGKKLRDYAVQVSDQVGRVLDGKVQQAQAAAEAEGWVF